MQRRQFTAHFLFSLRALDAWFAYLCTRESILRKHYSNNSLFVGALSCANSREVVDAFLNILQPLAFCPFQLDLLYQYRQLHNSFGQEAKKQAPATRPRSCHIYDDDQAKKRWSHPPKFHVFDRLDDSEDYTDSLEHSPLNRASPRRAITNKSKLAESKNNTPKEEDPSSPDKFRRLQEKWEHLGRDTSPTKDPSPTRTTPKSKIPRLLTSPVKSVPPSNLPVPVKSVKSPSGIPSLKKQPSVKAQSKKLDSKLESPRRTSRLDQDGTQPRPHLARPSSLPYKAFGLCSNAPTPQRRAASTSLPRPHSIAAPPRVSNKSPPK